MSEKSNVTDNNDILESYRKSMGYSEKPLYNYSNDADIMDYEGLSNYARTFNLKKSTIKAIKLAITEAAASQRTSEKSMMATKGKIIMKSKDYAPESLVQTRQTHMREVAEIAELISNGLGLNADFAYIIGLVHDIGHTWNGHVGERILSSIGNLNDSTYIVHNAMGGYILKRENIIDIAMQKIKQFNPTEDLEEVKEFMRYVIDGVVSHNGEGTVGKILPKDKSTETMSQEVRKCFTEKGFDKTIMPATMEGAVIRYADILAYTRSDILDGFRLKDGNNNKIIKSFDDDYLSIIGTCLARTRNFEKMTTLENKFLLELYGLSKRIDELKKKANTPDNRVELERTQKEREIIEKKYKEFEKVKIKYAKEYIEGIEPKSKAKEIATSMMQDIFIKDLVEASKDKGYITMTPLMRKTLFALRDLNIRKIVPYTRRKYEIEKLPIAANSLVDLYTNVLVETGIAYNIIPEDVKSKINPFNTKEEQQSTEKAINNDEKLMYERKLCHYYQKQEKDQLEYIYRNTLVAMEDITKHDIAIALGEEEYNSDLKEIYYNNKINPIKTRIAMMGKTNSTMTKQDRELLLKQLLKEKQRNIERIVASKMAIEYVAGMTDYTIIWTLLEKNLISEEDIKKGYGRAERGKQLEDKGLTQLQKVFAKNEEMIYPDDIEEDDRISL